MKTTKHEYKNNNDDKESYYHNQSIIIGITDKTNNTIQSSKNSSLKTTSLLLSPQIIRVINITIGTTKRHFKRRDIAMEKPKNARIVHY
jgi:hypothetical protein